MFTRSLWVVASCLALCATSPVLAANTQPVSRGIANQTANEDGPPITVSLFNAFDDAEDADSKLKFVVASNTTPTLVQTSINAQTGQLTLTLRANQNGVAQLLIRCTDTGGQSAQASFRVTVNPVPDSPILGPIALQRGKAGMVTSFNVKGQDGDLPNDIVRYTLDAASLARGMTIATSLDSATIKWTPPLAAAGQTFSSTVTMLDRSNQLSAQPFQLQVAPLVVVNLPQPPAPPRPPLIAVNDRTTVAVGQSVNLTTLIRANDIVNGRPTRIVQVRFPFYKNAAEILQTSSTSSNIGLTYTNRGYYGTQVINYTIEDDFGQTDSGWLTIQAGGYVSPSEPGRPTNPVINITIPSNTAPGTTIGFVGLTDPDGGPLPRVREADANLFPELKTAALDAVVFNAQPAGTLQPADGLLPLTVDPSSRAIRFVGGIALAPGQVFIRNYLVYDGITGSPTSNNFNPNFGKIVVTVVAPP